MTGNLYNSNKICVSLNKFLIVITNYQTFLLLFDVNFLSVGFTLKIVPILKTIILT